MSKKNRFHWQKNAPKPVSVQTETGSSATLRAPSEPPVLFPISPAQLAANRATAQKSTDSRTDTGRAASSKNVVKIALTGRTVLLPTDDVEEYAALVTGFERDLNPVGQVERELAQIIADSHWRLRRIQALEHALYAHGHEQFAEAFQNCPEEQRYSKILLQIHLTYEKQFRNLQIQEARLDRRTSKAIAELRRLQAERTTAASDPDVDAVPNEDALFAALDAGFVPSSVDAQLASSKEVHENGFDFARHENSVDLAICAASPCTATKPRE
ncbi:MAG: hypothetical protein JO108_01650 [Acidobacteriaceae bacterium]|nr:hypothetical protein [Acidobacteriaceae bacterium]